MGPGGPAGAGLAPGRAELELLEELWLLMGLSSEFTGSLPKFTPEGGRATSGQRCRRPPNSPQSPPSQLPVLENSTLLGRPGDTLPLQGEQIAAGAPQPAQRSELCDAVGHSCRASPLDSDRACLTGGVGRVLSFPCRGLSAWHKAGSTYSTGDNDHGAESGGEALLRGQRLW